MTCYLLDTAHVSLQSKKLSTKPFENKKEKMINSTDEVRKRLKVDFIWAESWRKSWNSAHRKWIEKSQEESKIFCKDSDTLCESLQSNVFDFRNSIKNLGEKMFCTKEYHIESLNSIYVLNTGDYVYSPFIIWYVLQNCFFPPNSEMCR